MERVENGVEAKDTLWSGLTSDGPFGPFTMDVAELSQAFMKNETVPDLGVRIGKEKKDSPGVIVFPPALLIGTMLLGLLLGKFRPWTILSQSAPIFWIRVGACVLGVLGLALMVWGRTTMVRAGTNVPPHKPTLAIVTTGPFRFTRNPLYVGGTLIYVALTIALGSGWLLCLFLPMIITLRQGIVLREERYLAEKFGPEYLAYKARTRRWV
jgi:protein-S-isoprenylcysteine O-methyltransferase Ste14